MGKIIYTAEEQRRMTQAMVLSLGVGFLMLLIKTYAFFLTDSAAILSDSAESIVHIFAVSFATYSMWLSHRPPDQNHIYGHDRITFFSAGFEGALIIAAALFILFQATCKIIYGFTTQNLDKGMICIAIATILNGFLGIYLIRLGRLYQSIVLEADGKHILTDCITSLGVVLALVLTRLTGWNYIDPIIALLIGVNILWTGIRLIHNSFNGLMDRTDLNLDRRIRSLLDEGCLKYEIGYHHLRHRNSGNKLLIEVHLLFPNGLSIFETHETATRIEQFISDSLTLPVEFVSHLEPKEGHDEIHCRLLGHSG